MKGDDGWRVSTRLEEKTDTSREPIQGSWGGDRLGAAWRDDAMLPVGPGSTERPMCPQVSLTEP